MPPILQTVSPLYDYSHLLLYLTGKWEGIIYNCVHEANFFLHISRCAKPKRGFQSSNCQQNENISLLIIAGNHVCSPCAIVTSVSCLYMFNSLNSIICMESESLRLKEDEYGVAQVDCY